jgi:cytidylate kinase
MYRAAALLASGSGVSLSDGPALAGLLSRHSIGFEDSVLFLDGADISTAIRAPEVSEAASVVATHTEVRRAMVALQRLFASSRDTVMEGRDTATVVFPSAILKVYVIADVAIRSVRRMRDLAGAGVRTDFDSVTESLLSRDRRDRERADSPLRPCPSSMWLDTTQLSITGQVDRIVEAYRRLSAGSRHAG